MKKHRLIWFVWVSFPEELSSEMYTKYIELMTTQSRKRDGSSPMKTYSSSFCIFDHVKQAEKFAQKVANTINADMDVISNRQRKKWERSGKYTGYVVSPI